MTTRLGSALRKWICYRAIMSISRRWGGGSYGSCANRHTRVCRFGPLERAEPAGSAGCVASWEGLGTLPGFPSQMMTIVVRDTREPDGYSREELMEMLKTIREQEDLQGWKVPEVK